MTAFLKQVAAKLAGEINQESDKYTFLLSMDDSLFIVVTSTNPLVIISFLYNVYRGSNQQAQLMSFFLSQCLLDYDTS